mgnify:CR=1 FL=1
MNNGKVRIYELSRELNLDNRDILAVCDQLNISVKSHSSTISDAEAARIRSAAEKYTPSHSSSNRSSVSTQPANSQKSRRLGAQPPVKKQQILEIRRNRPVNEPKRPEPSAPAAPPEAANSSAPAASSPSRPQRLNSPPRPVKAGTVNKSEINKAEQTDSAALEEETLAEVTAEKVTPTEEFKDISPDVSSEVAAPELPQAPSVEEFDEEEDSLELIGPPARPMVKVQENRTSEGGSNRPILKRARQESQASPQAPAETADEPSVTITPSRGGESRGGERSEAAPIRSRSQQQDGKGEKQIVLKPKPVVELRNKPVRPSAERVGNRTETVEEDLKTGESDLLKDGPTRELTRPIPSKAVKRTRKWDEEEEEQEAQKPKTAVKAKRRSQVVDEDEDIEDIIDLEDEELDSDEDSPVQVSLSLMRPQRPKSSRPTQSKPQTATPTQRKRSTSGESKNYRRDRREQEVKERPEQIVLTTSLSVSDLATELVVPETEIIKALFFKGIAANINQILDIPTAIMVAEEFGVLVETAEAEAEAKKVTEMLEATDLESLQRRPPVVTIMGHVDHGKTTLLDSIRKTKVAQGEAGGITQHIGAYHVDVEHGGQIQQVVFLDTPGHEAFTAMRARGARVTDIAVLVVAADDGVRPQTIEAISHAKAAEVPIVVAINKIDKEEAEPERVKQELTEFGLVPEEWGGETIMVPVSAVKGDNLDTLLEMLLLVSEVEDLYANPDRLAKGTVIEANLDKARGPVATLLIQNGTLRVGDSLVVGSVFGKVRAMIDDRGQRVDAAFPSFAVEVLGLNDVPAAGDEFKVFADEKEARSVAGDRADQQRQSRLQQAMASRRVSLNTLSAKAQEGELKELNLILKADVQGSVEAILGAMQQLPQREVQVRVLLAAPGEITETDVDLAAASDAVIIGFNTTFASGARHAADEAGVDVRDYNIIYKLLEDVQGAMEGLLDPELVEEPLGQLEVRAVFPVGRGAVAGCYVQSGKAIRNCKIRVRRRNEVVFEGSLDSLKRMKDDVKEVNAGYECGIGIDSFKDWENGDIIETYQLITKRRTLTA